MNYLIMDIGGTAIKYAVMDELVHITKKGTVPTPQASAEALIETLGKVYDQLKDEVRGISISMPGMIDSSLGYCRTGGSLLYNDHTPFAELLGFRCNTAVYVENDGKCAALAELWKGNLRGCRDGLVVLFGTGVGGGIIMDRKLYKGKRFSAGEFSYMNTDSTRITIENLWGIRCGNRNLCKMAALAVGGDPEQMDGRKIFEMADQGNEAVLSSLRSFTKIIAAQLFSLQSVFDPERIAVGGGISAQPLFISYIREHLEQFYADILPFQIPHTEVVPCLFYNDSNLIGALYHLLTAEGVINSNFL